MTRSNNSESACLKDFSKSSWLVLSDLRGTLSTKLGAQRINRIIELSRTRPDYEPCPTSHPLLFYYNTPTIGNFIKLIHHNL